MNKYEAIYELVNQIPTGKLASYGMVASLLPGVTPRMVGFALAGHPKTLNIPWQRIINSSGGISPRPGSELQFELLVKEGIEFTPSRKIKWTDFRWNGPCEDWLETRGLSLYDFLAIKQGWPGN